MKQSGYHFERDGSIVLQSILTFWVLEIFVFLNNFKATKTRNYLQKNSLKLVENDDTIAHNKHLINVPEKSWTNVRYILFSMAQTMGFENINFLYKFEHSSFLLCHTNWNIYFEHFQWKENAEKSSYSTARHFEGMWCYKNDRQFCLYWIVETV